VYWFSTITDILLCLLWFMMAVLCYLPDTKLLIMCTIIFLSLNEIILAYVFIQPTEFHTEPHMFSNLCIAEFQAATESAACRRFQQN